jgi:hypothetical protein
MTNDELFPFLTERSAGELVAAICIAETLLRKRARLSEPPIREDDADG